MSAAGMVVLLPEGLKTPFKEDSDELIELFNFPVASFSC
ncbi:hypothetical protein DAQ1742_01840 [Dickeya aquatica]|uniref:Uncharacterized protein n=1 Tax=Dickeya aquatica TaxID=1401087 RepID=A0A375A9X1_9GAMM|nr:hypothetical protein DAQ1742_01840 [Dickeya aquatica]